MSNDTKVRIIEGHTLLITVITYWYFTDRYIRMYNINVQVCTTYYACYCVTLILTHHMRIYIHTTYYSIMGL